MRRQIAVEGDEEPADAGRRAARVERRAGGLLASGWVLLRRLKTNFDCETSAGPNERVSLSRK
jgi:hypothetical protein